MTQPILRIICVSLMASLLVGCAKQPDRNAILKAIKKGNIKVVQKWLNTATPEDLKTLGPVVLSEAIKDGRKDMVLKFFNKGIGFDLKQDSPLNPLML